MLWMNIRQPEKIGIELRTCVHNLNSLLLSPLHTTTALASHANMFNMAWEAALYSHELTIKSSYQSYEHRF
ncbi:hypothetical protein MIS46_03710 [Wielerella bovis]|uniref:hypothetical protein n=1 Tax=Wielerella bovis TaxID=2917790 RepID=UPI002018BD2E|nr:hypothetical protein [Wielerella bovis]ULJ63170.1 hypothetical protein MIS46_03710 [Wielerella bovis]